MVLTPIWRSAVNKVTGAHLSSILKAAVTALALAGLAGAAGAQAPVSPAPAAVKAPAQKAPEKPLWNTLTRPQQIALEPLAGEWDRMEGVRKQKWLEIANRYSSMKPDEQVRVHERMRDWLKMTPDERRLVRENYTRTKKIDPGQKSEEWEKYQQLPEEQKKKLAADAAIARGKKQVANLPSAAQSSVKTVEPLKRTPPPVAACPAGTVKNTAAPTPACVAAPAAAPAAVAPVVPTTVTPTPVAPAVPVPNAK
jgi:hypothetical protein